MMSGLGWCRRGEGVEGGVRGRGRGEAGRHVKPGRWHSCHPDKVKGRVEDNAATKYKATLLFCPLCSSFSPRARIASHGSSGSRLKSPIETAPAVELRVLEGARARAASGRGGEAC